MDEKKRNQDFTNFKAISTNFRGSKAPWRTVSQKKGF